MAIGLWQTVINALTPSDRISTTIPVPGDYEQQIADLEAKLNQLPMTGGPGGLATAVQRAALEKQIADLKQKKFKATNFKNAGIPPAPDQPGTFTTQIAAPKIGLQDLTIPI